MQFTYLTIVLASMAAIACAGRASSIKQGLRLVGEHQNDKYYAHDREAGRHMASGNAHGVFSELEQGMDARRTSQNIRGAVGGVRRPTTIRGRSLEFLGSDDTHEYFARSIEDEDSGLFVRGWEEFDEQLTIVLAQGGDSDLVIPLDDIPSSQTVLGLKTLIEPLFNIPKAEQELICNNRRLQNDGSTLESFGVGDGDMISVVVKKAGPPVPPRQTPQSQGTSTSSANQGVGAEAETVRLQALGEPRVLEQLRTANQPLAQAVNDPQRFGQLWAELRNNQREQQLAQQRRLERLEADPFDVEAQREIEEQIRQEQVEKNLELAMEYSPEAFGRVHMLYIPVEINGVPIKAFVDSGAQATIMSPSCAERCNIMRLIDKRFAGVARGVGTAAILGRVHAAQMKIGPYWLSASFTVLEGKDVDLLLGLDMLKRYQSCIDLKSNVLRIMDAEVPFLSENELPDNAKEVEEPTVDGPDGMKIGAETGAVIPADEASKGKSPEVGSSAKSNAASAAKSHWGQQSKSSTSASETATASTQPTTNQPSTSNAAASGPVTKEKIDILVSMGFSEGEARHALESTGGDVDLAASILYS